jgi:hypothetical protein
MSRAERPTNAGDGVCYGFGGADFVVSAAPEDMRRDAR